MKPESAFAGNGGYYLHQRLHERRLAATVIADYAEFLSALDDGVELAERGAVITEAQVLADERVLDGLALRSERSAEDGLVSRARTGSVAETLDVFQLRLRHLRFVRLIAEAVDERGKALDFFFPHKRVLQLALVSFLFLRGEGGVVAGVAARFAVFYLVDDVDDLIEEHSVVRNDDDRAAVFDKVILEPFDRAKIEVVGRLVEEQHLRFREQEPQQRDLRALAAGELAQRARKIAFREAETLDGGLVLFYVCVAAELLEALVKPRILARVFLAAVAFDRFERGVHRAFGFEQVGIGGQQLLLKRAAVVRLEVLLEAAQDGGAGLVKAEVGLASALKHIDLAGQRAEQRRFAAAVAPDNRDFFVIADGEVYFGQYRLAVVFDRAVGYDYLHVFSL